MSPKKGKTDDVKMVESIVVFADALGTKNQLRRPETAADFIAKIRRSSDLASRRLSAAERISSKMAHRWFSDCLCLSVPFRDHNGLIAALRLASQLQLEFLLNGVFLRGGVAMGPHYHSEHIDLGPALVEATETERLSKYPAIFLTKELKAHLQHAGEDVTQLIAATKEDESCFLNFFKLIEPTGRGVARDKISTAIEQVTNSLKQPLEEEPREKLQELNDKYIWLCDYFHYASGATTKLPFSGRNEFRSFSSLTRSLE